MNPVGRLRLFTLDRVYNGHKISPFVAHRQVPISECPVSPCIHEFQRAIRTEPPHQVRASVPCGAAKAVVMKTRRFVHNGLDRYVVVAYPDFRFLPLQVVTVHVTSRSNILCITNRQLSPKAANRASLARGKKRSKRVPLIRPRESVVALETSAMAPSLKPIHTPRTLRDSI